VHIENVNMEYITISKASAMWSKRCDGIMLYEEGRCIFYGREDFRCCGALSASNGRIDYQAFMDIYLRARVDAYRLGLISFKRALAIDVV
jgi:hypothetical protein